MKQPKPTPQDITAFNNAARDGDIDTLNKFLGRFGLNIVNERNHLGWTPLMYALQYNQLKAAELLLKYGGRISDGNGDYLDASIIQSALAFRQENKPQEEAPDTEAEERRREKLKQLQAPKVKWKKK